MEKVVHTNQEEDNTIVRINDHQNQMVAYFEFQTRKFYFSEYCRGSSQERAYYGITKDLEKYYSKRKFLFNRFSQGGIQIDRESWYSIIPECVSKYLCQRLKASNVKTVFEPFCGVGGICIHLCDNFDTYIANDIEKSRIQMLKTNLQVYSKKQHTLDTYCFDFLKIKKFPIDAVIICPPWGKIDTAEYGYKELDDIMNPKLSSILTHAVKFSPNIMLQMPKNTNLDNLAKVVNRCKITPYFTVERIMTGDKVSQLFIYFGNETFTNINNCQLYTQIYIDLDLHQKGQRKKVKGEIKQGSQAILKEIYSQHVRLHPKAVQVDKRTSKT